MTGAHTERISLQTKGEGHMLDITQQAQGIVTNSGLREGQCALFVPGATGALTTIEFEPGLQRDFPEAMDRLIPRGMRYLHDDTWHDGNGHSHVRASLLGPSLVVPFVDGCLTLGTWQQIVLCDFDARPRSRDVVVQVLGVKG